MRSGVSRIATGMALIWIGVGCSPPMAMTPPVPLAKGEVIWGGAAAGGLDIVSDWTETPEGEELYTTEINSPRVNFMGFSLWPMPGAPNLQFGGIAYLGMTAMGGGGLVRLDLVKGDKVSFGPQLEGGLLWGGAALPMSVGVGNGSRLYATPTFRFLSFEQVFLIPVGAYIPLGGNLALTLEAAHRNAGWNLGNDFLTEDINHTVQFGVGLSVRKPNGL